MSQKCDPRLVANKTTYSRFKPFVQPAISFLLLLIGLGFEYLTKFQLELKYELIIYIPSYLVVAYPIIWKALKKLFTRNIFNEFFLMTLATIGAFAIGEFKEAIAVMLFYAIGELFQEAAVNRAKRSIESLLKLEIEQVSLVTGNTTMAVHPKDVELNQVIKIKPGEQVGLDGILESVNASLNTSALTGESVPAELERGDSLFAGMINLNKEIEVKVTSLYADTKLSQILEMVNNAADRKAKTQQFITKFAKVYTPIVVFMAIGLITIPYFLDSGYDFKSWLYRALVFLVISCPCALVVSIPLGYFGGIGAGSRNGILFKGSNYLDAIRSVDTVAMDKTGTLTKGQFEVQTIETVIDQETFLSYLRCMELSSSHPIASAIVAFTKYKARDLSSNYLEEIAGHGLKGEVESETILVGNSRLLRKFNIDYDRRIDEIPETVVVVARGNKYIGHVVVADTVKEDSIDAIIALKKLEISKIVVLSGDKQGVVDRVISQLQIDIGKGGLLPSDKVAEVQELINQGRKVAFVGDGINDAPVIAQAHVGVAMGGLGSDVAIETADIVIQTDQPSKIATAIQISRSTNRVVWQNILLAFGVKIVVLGLGAAGLANLWEAIIADVGVALIAILNAYRIQRMNFN